MFKNRHLINDTMSKVKCQQYGFTLSNVVSWRKKEYNTRDDRWGRWTTENSRSLNLTIRRNCCILAFDPAKNAIPRWCTGRKLHILVAVMRGNRVNGNWLMKWDEIKKIPWYTHRLMHRKRVTCELHDSYFRLMTIKHAISKIEWANKCALNYYITQSRQKSS